MTGIVRGVWLKIGGGRGAMSSYNSRSVEIVVSSKSRGRGDGLDVTGLHTVGLDTTGLDTLGLDTDKILMFDVCSNKATMYKSIYRKINITKKNYLFGSVNVSFLLGAYFLFLSSF